MNAVSCLLPRVPRVRVKDAEKEKVHPNLLIALLRCLHLPLPRLPPRLLPRLPLLLLPRYLPRPLLPNQPKEKEKEKVDPSRASRVRVAVK